MIFKVPQFIEVEDKIFGPFTFKQFVYLAGGAGGAFVLWRLLPSYIAIFAVAPVIGLSVSLAFWRVNNRPFVILLESVFRYLVGSKLYVWKKEKPKKKEAKEAAPKIHEQVAVPTLSGNKLKDLAWSLDVQEKTNK